MNPIHGSIQTFMKKINELKTQKKVDELISLFEKEKSNPQIKLDVELYSHVIVGLNNRVDKVMEYIKEMDAKAIGRDKILNNYVFELLLTHKTPEEALAFKNTFVPDTITFNIYLKFLIEKEKWPEIDKLLEEMKARKLISYVTYLTLIVSLGERGHIIKIKEKLREMKMNNLPITVEIANAVLNAYSKNCKFLEMKLFYEDMKNQQIIPDQVTYNTCITGFSRNRDWKLCFSIYMDAINANLVDIITFTSIIQACGHMKNLSLLNIVLKDMQKYSVRPNEYTYAALIGAHSHCKNFNEAINIFAILEKEKIPLQVKHVGVFVHALSPSQIPKEVFSLWNSLKVMFHRRNPNLGITSDEEEKFKRFLSSLKRQLLYSKFSLKKN